MRLAVFLAFGVLAVAIALNSFTVDAQTRIEVSYAAEAHAGPVTGRLVVILATRETPEPRFTVHPLGSQIFAVDVEGLVPGEVVSIDESIDGYPLESLAALPAGEYFAQAVLQLYTRVQRSDGHTPWVPINDGKIATFNTATGNLYSEVVPVKIEEGSEIISIEMDQVIAPTLPQPDTEWVKHVRFQSPSLSEFWGHPIFINATVLLPRGYHESQDVFYPTIFTFGHSTPFSFSTDPASARGRDEAHPVTGLETGFAFYQWWISDQFPRVIAVSFQQQTPFFPDSYSINSANNGPYGDAMVNEGIPWLEQQFRMIAKPYARIVEGASTGGWQALALQLKYPEFFGGAWVLQPDPISFTRYGLINIYQDENAFEVPTGPFTTEERPMRRTVEGQVLWTMRDLSRFEAVLGSRGRSGFQLMGWEAVFGPVGADGYPRPLWDKETGKIDHEVAEYMRENGFDLLEFTRRNWSMLRPQLRGKLHFFCGDMDDFYLNLAVYEYEMMLQSVEGGGDVATFAYGRPRKGHSWHAMTWAQMVRDMAEHIRASAPSGADPSWIDDRNRPIEEERR